MFIVVSGSIGAGKSTVTRIFSRITGFDPLFETVEGHPYLEKFYKNPREYAFRTQVYFLWDRFDKHYNTIKSGRDVVADRCLYEDNIFAKVQHIRGDMDDDDYLRAYLPHYKSLTELLGPPDLNVYLRANLDTLMTRVRKRDRDMEKDIDVDYMRTLLGAYEEWIEEYPYRKLIIDTNHLDLTCDLHPEWLYVCDAIKTKVTKETLPDIAEGISRLLGSLPKIHDLRDVKRATEEIFGTG
ncbi:MAG: deoxynucleoside kinase [Chloroflexi bacterium]|nr:deoxynucleoside kinase [Chloroflexota bacterium]